MNAEERKKLAAEKKRLRAYQANVIKDLDSDDTVRVQFQNLEGLDAEKVPLEFNYQGVKNFVLLHNGIYDLPVCVVTHLRRRCQTPIYKQYDEIEVAGSHRPEPIDPEQRISGYRARFALIPVETEGGSVAV